MNHHQSWKWVERTLIGGRASKSKQLGFLPDPETEQSTHLRILNHLWAAIYKIKELQSYLRCCIIESPCCSILACIPVITTTSVKVFLQTSYCIVMATVALASLQVLSLFSICIMLIPTWRFLSAYLWIPLDPPCFYQLEMLLEWMGCLMLKSIDPFVQMHSAVMWRLYFFFSPYCEVLMTNLKMEGEMP